MILKKLPNSITISGEQFLVKTDFRVWLELLVTWGKNSHFELAKAIQNIFSCDYTLTYSNMAKTVEGLSEFLKEGSPYVSRVNANEASENAHEDDFSKEYDFELDGAYIYAAFKQQYNIDLTVDDLHIFQFLALFNCLSDKTKMSQIMYWRGVDLSTIEHKPERERLQRLKSMYLLPQDKEKEEKKRLNRKEINEKTRKELGF